MIIYCDIDGTLTNTPDEKLGKPFQLRISKLKELISQRHTVILWTGRGESYAKDFAERYKIDAYACLAKPDIILDDNPSLRPCFKDRLITNPSWLDTQ